MENILQIIADHFLVVRRLPFEVVSHKSYQEGDEYIKYLGADGSEIVAERTVVVQDFDLAYFQKTPPSFYDSSTPEERYARWKKDNPNGRKLLKTVRKVEKGGWWYVQPCKHTSSTVTFGNGDGNFVAPTLEEAVSLYLKSLT